ncbi:hypothetical protein QM012_009158 [Aureobasidium pullulans]|uniref:P-loop containing nucleoside triphosphate hydrolase protein n=1 Tax=Aureobasidium pullulans TaxID=5580 RepID=A0ABR0TGA9_AURPU
MDLQDGINHTLSLIFNQIEHHLRQRNLEGLNQEPFVLGLTGLQGSGKSTWANGIVRRLRETHALNAITISLDDLYKTHDDLLLVRKQNPHNRLLRTRGQPGTHDVQLARSFFDKIRALKKDEEICIPSFDKSRYAGEGDRAPIHTWTRVTGPVDVVVFEGWCLGFSPLSSLQLKEKHQHAQEIQSEQEADTQRSTSTLGDHPICHLELVNKSLCNYSEAFSGPQHFDALIHIDTNDLKNVYEWRWQQEQALVRKKGSGMTEEQVNSFVRGYMPAYEMYLEHLRNGFFPEPQVDYHGNPVVEPKIQIRVLLDRHRVVRSIEAI